MNVHFGFRHIAFRVAQLARSADFYEKVFGLRRLPTQDEGRMCVLTSPGMRDVLTLSESSVPTEIEGLPIGSVGTMGGVDHVGIEVADRQTLEEVVQRCLDAGGTLVGKVEMVPGYPSAFVRDLDGYFLQLYAFSEQIRERFA